MYAIYHYYFVILWQGLFSGRFTKSVQFEAERSDPLHRLKNRTRSSDVYAKHVHSEEMRNNVLYFTVILLCTSSTQLIWHNSKWEPAPWTWSRTREGLSGTIMSALQKNESDWGLDQTTALRSSPLVKEKGSEAKLIIHKHNLWLEKKQRKEGNMQFIFLFILSWI